MKAVAYLRVSTAAQGRSGLGLEAQREAVEAISRQRDFTLVAEFVEVESGKVNQRQELERALLHARMTGATLVIAKLDRLSRNAAFLLALRDSGVRFLAADVPDANNLTIGILAVVAQDERESISRRTKDALAAAKARIARDGVHVSKRSGRAFTRLGNPNGAAALRRHPGNAAAAGAVARNAVTRATAMRPVIDGLRAQGINTTPAMARALNERGILSPRSASWHPSTVASLLKRLNAENAKVR